MRLVRTVGRALREFLKLREHDREKLADFSDKTIQQNKQN